MKSLCLGETFTLKRIQQRMNDFLEMALPPMLPPSAGGDGADSDHGHDEGGLAIQEAPPQLKEPALYRVLLMNDDFTPMDFVVSLLRQFFNMNTEQATRVMLNIHTQGRGECAVYPRDIAESKVAQVNAHAREHQHPLLCTMERV